MTVPPPPPPPSVPPVGMAGYPVSPNPNTYADWFKRVLAYIIDYIPAAILGGIGYGLIGAGIASNTTCDANGVCTSTSSGNSTMPILGGLCLLATLAYWLWNRVWKMGTTGSSIGMGVVGTKAVKLTTGEPIGFGMNFLRQILLGIDFAICYIGVLWPLWDSQRQCLISDKATGTIVIPTK